MKYFEKTKQKKQKKKKHFSCTITILDHAPYGKVKKVNKGSMPPHQNPLVQSIIIKIYLEILFFYIILIFTWGTGLSELVIRPWARFSIVDDDIHAGDPGSILASI